MLLARRVGAALVLLLVIAAVTSASERQNRVEGTSLLPAATVPETIPPAKVAPALFKAASVKKPERCLDASRLELAKGFASHRSGSVAFAFLDECGRLVGEHRNRVYTSASVVKAMLLVAYLRSGDVPERDLSGAERDLLGRMIEQSDNGAANSVFAAVGEVGLNEVAEVAGMRRFQSSPSWGSSGITAADQALFLGRVERYVPKRHEAFVLNRLASVIDSQRWGIPEVTPRGWRVHFKGGWYPASDGWRVNQVAALRLGRRGFALAVLTDANPSFVHGKETVAGVAERLMGGYAR